MCERRRINTALTKAKGASERFRRGFTLIELLVVIAIIALLMSILMPALSKVRRQTKAVICMSNLHQWAMVFMMYTQDHDGSFTDGQAPASATENWGHPWMAILQPYLSDTNDLRLCPSAKKPLWDKNGNAGPGTNNFTFACWGITDPAGWGAKAGFPTGLTCSYTINEAIYNPPPGGFTTGSDSDYWRRADIRRGGRVPLLVDGGWFDLWASPDDKPVEDPSISWGLWTEGFNSNELRRSCLPRHDGYVNGLFMDYSTRRIGLKELWTLKWHKRFDINGPATLAGNGGDEWNCSQWWNPKAPWMKNYKLY